MNDDSMFGRSLFSLAGNLASSTDWLPAQASPLAADAEAGYRPPANYFTAEPCREAMTTPASTSA